MATYTITDDPDSDWDEQFMYKYRHKSSADLPTAQSEMDRRRTAGESGYLWKWENGEGNLMESCEGTTRRRADQH